MTLINEHQAVALCDSLETTTRLESIQHLISGPVLILCLSRENAISHWLSMIGPEDPVVARQIAEFSIRADMGKDIVHNGVHGSLSFSAVQIELETLFQFPVEIAMEPRCNFFLFSPPLIFLSLFVLLF